MFPNEIKLIETVRAYECLYNNKIYEYKNLLTKQTAWAEIASKLNISVLECRKKWNRLRNAFLHALIRRQSKSEYCFKKWKYEDEMGFLLPFMGYGTNDTASSNGNEIYYQDNDSSGSQSTVVHSDRENTPDRNKRKNDHQEYLLEMKGKRQRVEEGMINNILPINRTPQVISPTCSEYTNEDELIVIQAHGTLGPRYQQDTTEGENDMFHATETKIKYEDNVSLKDEEDASESETNMRNTIKTHKVDFHEEMLHIIKEKMQRKKTDKDEIDLLFGSLALAVKQLPKTEQVKVKIDVTKLVYEAQKRCESQ